MRGLIFLMLVSQVSVGFGQEIAVRRDRAGRVIYESKPGTVGSKIKLPVIVRENTQQRLVKIKEATPPTCHKHGGVDCIKGADSSDGSAICLDGYRDSKEDFISLCSSTKLQIISEHFFAERGNELARDRLFPKGDVPSEVSVTVRNLTAVSARKVKVTIIIAKRKIASSPIKSIEPFGLEDFLVRIDKKLLPPYADFQSRYKAVINCVNCLNSN